VYVHDLFEPKQVEHAGCVPSHFSRAVRHWSQARETRDRFVGRSEGIYEYREAAVGHCSGQLRPFHHRNGSRDAAQ
jgi:hypothetical protein